jgi:hypothetical protein
MGRLDNHSISPGASNSVPTRDIGRFHRSGSSLPIADRENAWPKIMLQSLGSLRSVKSNIAGSGREYFIK